LRMGERSEWLARFREAGVPASAVLSPGETKDDPQFRFRGMIDERGHARSPLPLAERIDGAVPALGEHTEEILRELG
jgi:crotonobetainyl-CoA:carnitine CoA-transferase CaiB-like acyl-CoA transferase